MSGERTGDCHDGGHPASTAKSPAGLEATAVTGLPGLFEHVLVERRPSHAREEWNKVGIVCTEMRHVPTGRTPNPEELRQAAAAAATVLILHFPEGPIGAEKAQRAYCKWLDNIGAEPRPGRRPLAGGDARDQGSGAGPGPAELPHAYRRHQWRGFLGHRTRA